jgi:hypothetical protein
MTEGDTDPAYDASVWNLAGDACLDFLQLDVRFIIPKPVLLPEKTFAKKAIGCSYERKITGD